MIYAIGQNMIAVVETNNVWRIYDAHTGTLDLCFHYPDLTLHFSAGYLVASRKREYEHVETGVLIYVRM